MASTQGEDWDDLEGADERKLQDRHAGHGGQPTQRDRPFHSELRVGTLNALVSEAAEAVGQNPATGRPGTAL